MTCDRRLCSRQTCFSSAPWIISHRLALDLGQMANSPGMDRHGRSKRIGYLLPDDLLELAFHRRECDLLLSLLEGENA